MMNRLLSIFILIIILSSCSKPQSGLDDIKAFKPDKKYFKANLVTLHYIIETSPITKVDTAFQNIINQYGLPVDAKLCPDGTFTGESPYDAFDYKHIIKIQIKDEKIINADYNEIHVSGSTKQEDSVYCAEMSVMGTTPAISYPKMERQLIDEQNLMKVDAVTGSTYSLYRFRYATTIALMRSRLKK